MSRISAETYIRRCAEDALLESQAGEEGPGELRERARALIAAGLLDREVARAVLAGYSRARMLRGMPHYDTDDSPSDPPPLERQRVCGCDGEITASGATVLPRLVVLAARYTRMAVTLRVPTPAAGPGRRRMHMSAQPPTLTLRDDTGRSVTADFSGGGGDDEWRGWYTAEPGLSPTTEWIDIGRTRLTLREADTGAQVRLDHLLDPDASVAQRAARYLEHSHDFRRTTHEFGSSLGVVDAFVACGVLSADASAVQAALDGADDETSGMLLMARRRHVQLPAARHGAQARTARSIPVGAIIPAFDGVTVSLNELALRPDGFSVEFEGFGQIDHGHSQGSIDGARLAFAASDDRGTEHLGSFSELSEGSDGFSGVVEFDGPLDGAARSLDVLISTEGTRATVHIPLSPEGTS